MSERVQELSSPESIAAQEANFFAYWSTFGCGPGGELYQGADQTRFTSGIASPFLNGIVNAQLSPTSIDTTIEANRAYFAERGMPALWWISPSTQPADLGQHLMRQGLASSGQQPMMALDLASLPAELALPPDFRIVPVDDEATLRAWSDIVSVCFGLPQTGPTTFFDLEASLGVESNPARYRLIGYHNTTPVATACLMPGAGIAGIYTIAVLEQARRHGFGGAITLAVSHEARRQGYAVASLQATVMGRPVYRRLGFQEVAMLDCYVYPGAPADADEQPA